MSCRKYFLLTALFILRDVCITNVLAADEDLRERFLRDAPAGWAKMSDLLLHSRSKIQLKVYVRSSDEEQLSYTVDTTCAFNGTLLRRVESIMTLAATGRQSSYANARNLENAFEVQRGLGEPDRYSLNANYSDPALTMWDPHELVEDGTWQVDPLIFGPFSIYQCALSEICKSPSFQILDVHSVEDGVFVSFQDKHPLDGTYRECAVTLDPENSWAVLRYHLECPSPKKQDLRLAFDGSIVYEDVPFEDTQLFLPKKAIENQGVAEELLKGGGERFEYTMVSFVQADVPESEFALSAFGLSKTGESLKHQAKTKAVSWLLYINVGVLLAALGFWLMRRQKRSTSA